MAGMKRRFGWLLAGAGLLLCASGMVHAQTTGKIAGRVLDQETGSGLPGASVQLEGTTRGAAADANGDFFILNVPPGSYVVRVQMMGYEPVRVTAVQVSVNRTATVEVKLKPTVLTSAEEVVVMAERLAVKKDQTSSIRNVSSEQIENLPVESVAAVVSLQPGVVAGHFRGGRTTEVSYLIDGLQVDESFGGEGKTVDLEPEAIQDLEVITGTFNAEYGRAMSGVVNAVTKDGSESYHGAISAELGNYYTPHKDIFIGLRDEEFDRNQDYKFQLSGPVPLLRRKLTFFSNLRYQNYRNHLNGLRRFRVSDFSNFQSDNPAEWVSEHTGDSAYVPMNGSQNVSFTGKLTSNLFRSFKTSLLYNYNDDVWHSYDHAFKYNPDGMAAAYRRTHMYALQLNHLFSRNAFYEIKLQYVDYYNGWYVYKNPLDPRYVNDRFFYNDGPGFYTGGQQKGHVERTLKDFNAKFDLSWQVHKHHSLKTGVLYTHHNLDNRDVQIRNLYAGTDQEFLLYQPVIFPDSSIYSDIYRVKPREFSAYLQDKMEFDEMVINLGVRYDYFDPNTVYPSQRRNPANQLRFPDNPEKMSTYPRAKPQTQISPRLGLSYQLSDVALLHFSYGHFFQMPPMYALYENHSFQVAPTDYETTMGNAQVKAEKTVQYEIGLWQQLAEGMGVDVALFYRDIYDLLSARIVSTFNQIEYGLYSNKDYGNARGLEVKYDFVSGKVFTNVNYTLQFTRGNADNPRFTFDRAGDSRDPIPTLIPMSWDQRHTLNASVGYNTAKYGATLTGYYNSGTPYTMSPLADNRLALINLHPNNAKQPSQYSVDLTAYYNLRLAGNFNARFTLSVYNLLDRLNEVWVNPQTGRAYTAIITPSDLAGHRSNFNEFIDRVQNPAMYSTPRYVKLGMGITF
ncbi:MAG: TonB-dependent receptor [candidate division KSB1 bacterium]|nr:TonB-dependent receptor [candidate division KSB1 bacterium]MDZ7355405.1 TonB-dependent receptor [candidate division KSB1 bacterium]MDZ7410981.1 TonB-dependent receptor [candidate division KSB1 bacterium]